MVANLEQGRGKCSLLNSPKPLLCIVCTSIFNKIYCDSHLERDRRIRLIYEFIYTGFVQKYGNTFDFTYFIKYLLKYLMVCLWNFGVYEPSHSFQQKFYHKRNKKTKRNKNWKKKKKFFNALSQILHRIIWKCITYL